MFTYLLISQNNDILLSKTKEPVRACLNRSEPGSGQNQALRCFDFVCTGRGGAATF